MGGIDELLARVNDDGGLGHSQAQSSRVDATAWAAIALQVSPGHDDVLEQARRWLTRHQKSDGRVALKNHSGAAWPTPLAVLAWSGSEAHQSSCARAVEFLLGQTGLHWKNDPYLGHDTSIPGWPWIDDTHSWVEPTALAILALTIMGKGDHPRVKEGLSLIRDRMLPDGGWNYGNTTVLGTTLRPLPQSTGVALAALAGNVEEDEVSKSLEYLSDETTTSRTPLTLGWALLGLSAWGRRPDAANDWCEETLARQKSVGPYDTNSLAVLLTGLNASQGLLASLQRS